jgi:hypothetical protein
MIPRNATHFPKDVSERWKTMAKGVIFESHLRIRAFISKQGWLHYININFIYIYIYAYIYIHIYLFIWPKTSLPQFDTPLVFPQKWPVEQQDFSTLGKPHFGVPLSSWGVCPTGHICSLAGNDLHEDLAMMGCGVLFDVGLCWLWKF